jgi:pimeloyl-ACP methyl ester carboxylesterase
MGFYRKNGFEFSWTIEGEGKPLVFLPGWAEIPDVWRLSEADRLKGYQKVFLDLGGHFPAEFPKDIDKLTHSDFLGSHFEILTEIANDNIITLIGHSTGALVGYAYANQFPEKVRKFIGVGTFLQGPLRGSGRFIPFLKSFHASFLIDFAFAFSQISYSSFLDTVFGLPIETKQDILNRPDIANFLHHFYNKYRKIEPKNLRLILEFLDEYRLEEKANFFPATFIHGKKDPVVDFEEIQEFTKNHSNQTLIPMEGIGHSPHIENIPLFWDIIIEVLRE